MNETEISNLENEIKKAAKEQNQLIDHMKRIHELATNDIFYGTNLIKKPEIKWWHPLSCNLLS